MADEPQTIRAIHWRELFPFLHIFRAFRVAVHPSKLVLGLVALLTIYAGGRILDGLWPASALPLPGELSAYEGFAASDERDSDRAFERRRDDGRRAADDAYADALVRAKLAPDAAQAREPARRRDHYGDLKRWVMAERDRRVREADDTRQKRDKEIDDDKNLDAAAKQREHDRARDAYDEAVRDAFEGAHASVRQLQQIVPRGVFAEFFDYEAKKVNEAVYGVMANNWTGGAGTAAEVQQALRRAEPAREGVRTSVVALGVFPAVKNFLTVGPAWLFRYHLLYAILFTLLFLLVWAVFGGAICRIAAVHVARDEKISVRQALRFSISKVLSFVFAPVIPLLIVLGIGVVLAIGGLLFYVPWIGPIAAGVLFVLALLGGLVITLVLFGTVGGLNLMYPTIAVEGSDSFDAISRSFSYVFARPWRMLFYTAVAIGYGALTYLFVKFFIYVLLASTHYFVGWWLGGQPGRWYPEMWPAPAFASLPYDIDFVGLKLSEQIAAAAIAFWVFLTISLLGAFAISFYFSSSTIIYYLMRREVDATELEDVYVEEAEDELADTGPVVPLTGTTTTATTVTTTTVVGPTVPETGATSAPGGGVTGTAGSSPPGSPAPEGAPPAGGEGTPPSV